MLAAMRKQSLLVAGIFLATISPAYGKELSTLTITQEPFVNNKTIPQGAQRVPMATMTLKASCDADVTITKLNVRHEGLGKESDISGVYVADGKGKRITGITSFNGTPPKAVLRFRTLTIPKCTTAKLTILADIAATAQSGAEHRVSITASSDVESTAETVSIISSSRASTYRLAPATNGTITVKYPSLPKALTYGKNRVVSRIQLTANQYEDHLIDAITVTNKGKARNGHLVNLSLRTNTGEHVGSSAKQLDGDSVTFTFDPPLLLEKNETRLLNLHADIRAGKKLTIKFLIQEPSDIAARTGKQRTEKFQ